MFVHLFEQLLIVFLVFVFFFCVFFLVPLASVAYPCFSHGRAVALIPTSVASRFSCLLMYGSVNKPAEWESLSYWGHLNNLAFRCFFLKKKKAT